MVLALYACQTSYQSLISGWFRSTYWIICSCSSGVPGESIPRLQPSARLRGISLGILQRTLVVEQQTHDSSKTPELHGFSACLSLLEKWLKSSTVVRPSLYTALPYLIAAPAIALDLSAAISVGSRACHDISIKVFSSASNCAYRNTVPCFKRVMKLRIGPRSGRLVCLAGSDVGWVGNQLVHCPLHIAGSLWLVV